MKSLKGKLCAPTPSFSDITTTKKLLQALKLLSFQEIEEIKTCPNENWESTKVGSKWIRWRRAFSTTEKIIEVSIEEDRFGLKESLILSKSKLEKLIKEAYNEIRGDLKR